MYFVLVWASPRHYNIVDPMLLPSRAFIVAACMIAPKRSDIFPPIAWDAQKVYSICVQILLNKNRNKMKDTHHHTVDPSPSLWPQAGLAFDRSMADLLCHRNFFSCNDNTLNARVNQTPEGGCSEGLHAFRFFSNNILLKVQN